MRDKFLLLIAIACLAAGCTHAGKNLPAGMQGDYTGFIAARIAVFPCRAWPEQDRYQGWAPSNVDHDVDSGLCQRLNRFVLEGFEDQPYMRGLTPDAVRALLKKAEQLTLLDKERAFWEQAPEPCRDCKNPQSFYAASIAPQTEWLAWLGQLSRSARNVDAALFPFALSAHEENSNERGVQTAVRKASVVMLLVDTNNGKLVWSGGREAEAVTRSLDTKAPLAYASWDEVYDRLLTSDIWRGFPGRQVYE